MYRRGAYLFVTCLLLLCSGMPGRVAAQPLLDQQGTSAVVATYYQILNAGLKSGDFSAMASVYAPDATLARSTPLGETITLHGLKAIIAYYHQTSLAMPAIQFVRDTWYQLSPTILLNYEHTVGGVLRVGARCSHLFVLENGRIKQLFWVAYFGGKR